MTEIRAARRVTNVTRRQEAYEQEQFNSRMQSLAELVYEALMSIETHTLELDVIYKWIERNSPKDLSESWKTNIRRNLCMNKVSLAFPTYNIKTHHH